MLRGAALLILCSPSSRAVRRLLRRAERATALGVAAVVLLTVLRTLRRDGLVGLVRRFTTTVITAVRTLPGGSALLDVGLDAAVVDLLDEIAPVDPTALSVLPPARRPVDVVEAELLALVANDESGGKLTKQFGGLYHNVGDSDRGLLPLDHLQRSAACALLSSNVLYPTLFRVARKLEAEVVAMAVSLLKGRGLPGSSSSAAADVDPAPEACGLLASGGTESILLAVKVHRDAALEALGYVSSAEDVPAVVLAARHGIVLTVLAGITAHPALDKACELFAVRLVKLPVDDPSQALQASTIASALTPSTCLIHTSAPTFPHGVVDPIPEIASVARAYTKGPHRAAGVPVHVDNCLGGVHLSFAFAAQAETCSHGEALDRAPIPPFDFRVPGVATISMDIHKYGGAPKGSSVVAFATSALRRRAFTTVTNWPGGQYATPTMAGSRSGVAAGTAWATMVYNGAEGYASATALVTSMHTRVVRELAAMPGVAVVGQPAACIVAFTAAVGAGFGPYQLAARMEVRGWHLALLQQPAALHICITERLAEPMSGGSGETVLDAWLRDMRECAAASIENPKDPQFARGSGAAGIYGAAVVLPGSEIGRILQRYCDTLYAVRPSASSV